MKSLIGAVALSVLAACGSEGPTLPPPPPPAPTPAANITASGAGVLVLHPSLDSRYTIAMETPIRITETAGGSADWSFARMSLFRNGVQVERTEIGANVIQAAGYGRIALNSNAVYRAIFRFNSDDFDRVDITLGFNDVRDGRSFTVDVPFGSFTDVDVNFTPLAVRRSNLPR